MCLARSVLGAIEHYNNKNVRLARFIRTSKLTRRCIQLYKEAGYSKIKGVKLGEIENFFKNIPTIFNKYKIHVYDVQTMGKRILSIGKGEKDLFLLKEEGHFNVIKSITGFRAGRYYCLGCDQVLYFFFFLICCWCCEKGRKNFFRSVLRNLLISVRKRGVDFVEIENVQIHQFIEIFSNTFVEIVTGTGIHNNNNTKK